MASTLLASHLAAASMVGASGEWAPASRQMASQPSRASAAAPPDAIRARTLSRTSSGRTPRQSASRCESHWGLCW
eukprot:1733945-Alexandrium_andersonii.AAC.1